MNLPQYLRRRAELEFRFAALYEALAEKIADPPTARLFAELAAEENAHGQSLEMLARLAPGLEGKLTVPENFPSVAQQMETLIAGALDACREGRPLVPKKLLQLAIGIENSSLETEGPEAFLPGNPEFARTFRMLHIADRTHAERLRQRLAELP